MPPPDATPEPAPQPAAPAVGRLRGFLRSYFTPAGKQALRNLIGLVICTVISQGCAFGVLLILTQGLSPTGFGAVIFALNLQIYLVTLGTFGLGSIVVRDLTQDPDHADETTTAFLTIVTVASLLTGIVAAIVTALVPISWDERVMLWCLAAGNVFACLNLSPLFDAAHRQALSAVLMVPADVLALGIIGGLYWLGELTVPAVGFVMLGKLTLVAVLHLLIYNRTVRPFHCATAPGRRRRMMRAGRPMMWASLLSVIPVGGSVVLIRLLTDAETTAIYGLAFQIVAIEILVLMMLMRILQPHITGSHGLAPEFRRQLILVVSGTLLGLVIVSLGTGWVLFSRVLRPDYQPAYSVLVVMQLYIVCCGLASVVNGYLIRFHREWWIRVEHTAATVGYLALAFFIGQHWRFGFAMATGLSGTLLLAVGLLGLTYRTQPQNAEAQRG